MESSTNAFQFDTNVSNFVSVKLSGSCNYHLWKAQMLCLLDSNNMCGIVDAAFVAPRDYDNGTVRQYDSLVKGWIFGSVSENVLVNVFNLDSARAVWEKLKSIYDPTTCLQEEIRNEGASPDIDDVLADTNATPIEIIVGEDIVPTETETKNEGTHNTKNKIKDSKKLYAATIKGDWSEVETILKHDEGLVTEAISSDGSTILHIAVGRCHNLLVENLLSCMNDEQVLQKRDSDGSTALHIAAIVGNKYAAELLVKKNNKLLGIEDHKGEEPLHKAYKNMHAHTIEYLMKAVNDDGKTELKARTIHHGVDLLVNHIYAKQYTLALELVQKFPDYASKSDDVLMAIAKTLPSEVDSDRELVISILYVLLILITLVLTHVVQKVIFLVLSVSTVLLMMFLILKLSFNMSAKKKERYAAKKVLKLVCDEIDKLDYSGTHHPYYTRPVLEAACQNHHRVVEEILYRSPEAIHSTDTSGYDIIQLAIIHRSKEVCNLITNIGERKILYRTLVDSSKNNILHLVGRLAPSRVLNKRTGAALQLQRELQWREEVKKIVLPTCIIQENNSKETPDMVFTRTHRNLLKEGEQWMKTTANSSSIIAALITTIVFAATITVPGGSDNEKGTPLFKNKTAFIVFAISDAISLVASCTSLLALLSILASRFAEEDFLVSLPRRLIIGLFSLIISKIAMMVAFSATLFLVFSNENQWMLVPICALTYIPVAVFVGLEFPLIVDLLMPPFRHCWQIKEVCSQKI